MTRGPLIKPQKVRMDWVCTKCTFAESFAGEDVAAAAMSAKYAGWAIRNDKAICRRCPK